MKTIKHNLQGFLLGVVITVFCIGFWQIQIRFSAGPAAYELTQTEQTASQLAKLMPKVKP